MDMPTTVTRLTSIDTHAVSQYIGHRYTPKHSFRVQWLDETKNTPRILTEYS